MEIEWANPNDLVFNPWNPNDVSDENMEKLDKSYQQFGMFKPIVVRRLSSGQLEVIGGEHRVKIAQQHNDKIPIINLGVISDDRAKKISLIDNGQYGSNDLDKLSEVIATIVSEDDDLSTYIPFSSFDIEQLLQSVGDFDLDSLNLDENDDSEQTPEDTDNKNPAATHQLMRFKVRVERADAIVKAIEKEQKASTYRDHDELINAGEALISIINKYNNN